MARDDDFTKILRWPGYRVYRHETKVPMGVVEAVNANIKALVRRGRGYRDLNYLLLKARYMAATKTEFVVLRRAA